MLVRPKGNSRMLRLVRRDDGAVTIEYGLLLIAVVTAAVTALALAGPALTGLYGRAGAAVSSAADQVASP